MWKLCKNSILGNSWVCVLLCLFKQIIYSQITYVNTSSHNLILYSNEILIWHIASKIMPDFSILKCLKRRYRYIHICFRIQMVFFFILKPITCNTTQLNRLFFSVIIYFLWLWFKSKFNRLKINYKITKKFYPIPI